jgi:hypothetical protein
MFEDRSQVPILPPQPFSDTPATSARLTLKTESIRARVSTPFAEIPGAVVLSSLGAAFSGDRALCGWRGFSLFVLLSIKKFCAFANVIERKEFAR